VREAHTKGPWGGHAKRWSMKKMFGWGWGGELIRAGKTDCEFGERLKKKSKKGYPRTHGRGKDVPSGREDKNGGGSGVTRSRSKVQTIKVKL